LEEKKMRIGSNGSIPEFIAEVAEAIEEAVSENQYATGCEIPEQYEPPTYNPGGYNERCGYDNTSWLRSDLLKKLAPVFDHARNEKLAGLATQGNATDYLMAATGQGGTTYTGGVSPFAGAGLFGPNDGITPDKFEQNFKDGKTMVVSTKAETGPGFMSLGNKPMLDQYGLKGDHCYTVKRVYTDDTGKKMVELADPTGASTPRPIPMDQLTPNFVNQIAVG
jgi:hypothetical protein